MQLRVAYAESLENFQGQSQEIDKESPASAQLWAKLLQLGVNLAIDNRYGFAYAWPRAGGGVNGGRKSGEFKQYERAYRYHVGESVEGDFPDLSADVKDSAGCSAPYDEELVRSVAGRNFLLIPADVFKEVAYWSESYVVDEEDGTYMWVSFISASMGLIMIQSSAFSL